MYNITVQYSPLNYTDLGIIPVTVCGYVSTPHSENFVLGIRENNFSILKFQGIEPIPPLNSFQYRIKYICQET